MQPLEKNPNDPTPSRFYYRWERLLLTPYFRRIIHFGFPLFLIGLFGVFYFSKAENIDMLKTSWREFKENSKNRPEFLINFIKINGAHQALLNEIRLLIGVDLPISSYDINLDKIKEKIELLKEVKSVNLYINENIIYIQVQARQPAIYWLNGSDLELLDSEGVSMRVVSNVRTSLSLPLIAGVGANQSIDEAMFIYANSKSFSKEILGLVRVGERRWDLILKNGKKIMLPAEGLETAFRKLIKGNSYKKLSLGNFSVLDLRNLSRMMIRQKAETNKAVEIKLRSLEEGSI